MKIENAKFTLTNNLSALPEKAVRTRFEDNIEVNGTITAHFSFCADIVRESWRRHVNKFLRQVRPHVPKRKWRRLRGKVKAQW